MARRDGYRATHKQPQNVSGPKRKPRRLNKKPRKKRKHRDELEDMLCDEDSDI